MELIETLEDLVENARTLSGYFKNGSPEELEFTKNLVSHGKAFCVFDFNGELSFFPSRFLGYKNNTKEKHENGRLNRIIDGKETTPKIDKIIKGRSLRNVKFEKEYEKFCELIGIKKRIQKIRPRFWETILKG